MPKVKFRTNLGRVHANELGVDWEECSRDAEVDVPKKAADWLVAKNIATLLEKEVTGLAKQSGVKGIRSETESK
jgi:hypothetical protein